MSNLIRRAFLVALVVGAFCIIPTKEAAADHDGYWNNHWNWHDNHYSPYYQNRYNGYSGSYGTPYYGNSYYGNSYYGNPNYSNGYYGNGYYGGYAPGAGVQVGNLRLGVGGWW